MSQVSRSKILEEIIVQFRKKGVEVPESVLADLRAARSLMSVEQTEQRGFGETSPKIDECLGNVEAYLITEAQSHFPSEKVDEWLRKLNLTSCESCVVIEQPKQESRFVTGIPREQKWIRLEPIESLPLAKLEQLVTESSLSFKEEVDGHLTVYGTEEAIKAFIKKIARQNPSTETSSTK